MWSIVTTFFFASTWREPKILPSILWEIFPLIIPVDSFAIDVNYARGPPVVFS